MLLGFWCPKRIINTMKHHPLQPRHHKWQRSHEHHIAWTSNAIMHQVTFWRGRSSAVMQYTSNQDLF